MFMICEIFYIERCHKITLDKHVCTYESKVFTKYTGTALVSEIIVGDIASTKYSALIQV